jgi:hypothetical protein
MKKLSQFGLDDQKLSAKKINGKKLSSVGSSLQMIL